MSPIIVHIVKFIKFQYVKDLGQKNMIRITITCTVRIKCSSFANKQSNSVYIWSYNEIPFGKQIVVELPFQKFLTLSKDSLSMCY